jgi:hypothetical protein
MLQPAAGYMTCRLCDASYESETELIQHQKMSHRRGSSQETTQSAAVVKQSEDDPQD